MNGQLVAGCFLGGMLFLFGIGALAVIESDGEDTARREFNKQLSRCYAHHYTIGQCAMDNGWELRAP